MSALATKLNDLDRFPVDQVESFALLRRVDTKFLCSASKLADLISRFGDQYGVLPASGNLVASYRSLYFDSPDKMFYHQHRRGQRDRFKIRVRHYIDRELSYLEVKRKTNHNVTVKTRVKRDYLSNGISSEDQLLLSDRANCDSSQIEPQMWISFSRITLIGLGFKERLTIDLGLTYETDNDTLSLDGLAIVEIKQPRFWSRSPAMLALRGEGIRPSGMSKYCTALIALFPGLRYNRFRPTFRNIRRMTNV